MFFQLIKIKNAGILERLKLNTCTEY